jgi:hypothetical protein
MKYIPICLLFLFSLLSLGTLQAQIHTHTLHFKDGGRVQGRIIEQKVGESVLIRLTDGQIKTFSEAEILRIERMEEHKPAYATPPTYTSRREALRARPFTQRKDRSMFNLFSFGLGFGTNTRGNAAVNPSLTYRLGYRFNQYVNAGAGFSLDPYEGGLLAPIFATFHGDLGRTKRVMPHYFADLGYGVPMVEAWNVNELKGGVYYQVGGGYKFLSRGSTEWILSLSYRSQDSWQRFDDWRTGGEVVGGRTYRRIVFQVTLGF